MEKLGSSSSSSSSEPSSPEFQFCPPSSFPMASSCAGELFADGILLPTNPITHSSTAATALVDPTPPPPSGTKWPKLFTTATTKNGDKTKRPVKERKRTPVGSTTELNINIWPFTRSRSAGNSARGAKTAAAAAAVPLRKSSSASGGGGIRVGRVMQEWRLRKKAGRGGGGEDAVEEEGRDGRMFSNLRTIFSKKVVQ